MSHTITLIPGDGIGPEVSEAVVRIFKVAGLDVEWDRHDAGVTAFKRFNQTLPLELLDSVAQEQGRAQGAGHDARLARGSRASTSGCARRSTSSPTCGR